MSSRDKQQTWAQMGQVGTAGGTWRSSADHFTSSEMWEETNPPAERRECLGAGGTGSVRPGVWAIHPDVADLGGAACPSCSSGRM